MHINSWAISMIGAGALVTVAALWQPWRADAASLNRPRPTVTSPTPSLQVVTWHQAKVQAPSLIRQPTWLPPGTSAPALLRDPVHGQLTVTYTGPNNAWTIQIAENAGPTTIANPNETAGVIAGVPVTLSQWTASSGAQMSDVFFRLNGNGYDVLGINTPQAALKHVAAGLIRP